MKKATRLALILFLLITAIVSCQKDYKIEEPNSPKNIDNLSGLSDNMKNMLINMGFKLKDIRDGGEYIIAEGDIAIDKKVVETKINECQNNGKVNQGNRIDQFSVNSSGVVDWNKVSNIKFFIHSSISGSDWINSIRAATQDWESIANVNINFTEVNNANDADITFYDINYSGLPACFHPVGATLIGLGIFPINGSVGSMVGLNLSYGGYGSGDDGKISLIKHEVGHTLGFRHASQEASDYPDACVNPVYGDNQLPLTPVFDASSVMFTQSSITTAVPFDSYDIMAAQCLYPSNCCAPSVTSVSRAPFLTLSIQISPENPLFYQYIADFYNASTNAFAFSHPLMRIDDTNSFVTSRPSSSTTSYYITIKGLNYKGDYTSPSTAAFYY